MIRDQNLEVLYHVLSYARILDSTITMSKGIVSIYLSVVVTNQVLIVSQFIPYDSCASLKTDFRTPEFGQKSGQLNGLANNTPLCLHSYFRAGGQFESVLFLSKIRYNKEQSYF